MTHDADRSEVVVGQWLGIVNYESGYADGRRDMLYLDGQLAPFHMLRKL